MKLVLTAITVVAMTISVGAQWLNHPTPGIPRTADGKVNLTAAAPRAVDGKPDLTGLWTGPLSAHLAPHPGVPDPRRIVGPARIMGGKLVPLPHLVPQVDRDGNDVAGIRDPEVAVPLATTTGWNFRDASVGNPGDIYQLLGSYIPFATTNAAQVARNDPRLSIEERYRGVDDYLRRIRSAAMELIRDRFLLQEDLDHVLTRAKSHWEFATRERASR